MSVKTAVIKYRYATGSDESIVDVYNLNSEKRHDLAPYSCIGCRGELIPNLGQKKVNHFSHKSAGACSGETYLHQLAKEGFRKIYAKCLANKLPFVFECSFPSACNHFEWKVGLPCKVEKIVEVDLTKYFKLVELEKSYLGFVPDILLSTENGSEVLFVEIAVSHKCEENKISLGKRIIEIEISDESDFEQILNRRLVESSPSIKTYNFKKRKVTEDICNGNCHRNVNLFIVYESKKSISLGLPMAEAVSRSRHKKVKHYEISEMSHEGHETTRADYRDKVREAYFNEIPIKNCFLCRYHGSEGYEEAVFCKFRKEGVNPNEAVTCEYYRAFGNKDECLKAHKANDEYASKNEIRIADGISIPIF